MSRSAAQRSAAKKLRYAALNLGRANEAFIEDPNEGTELLLAQSDEALERAAIAFADSLRKEDRK